MNFRILILLAVLLILVLGVRTVQAAVGVPKILSYQGRLLDSNGNLLGGSGTPYCFRFSIYDSISSGTRLWPSGTPSAMTATVTNGVFDIGVGDTSAGGDALTYDFEDNDTVYLNVEVATRVDPVCTGADEVFETLSPRERIVASGYAINSLTVGGLTPSENASGTEIPVLASGTLTLGGTNPQVNATGTNTLTLQGGTGTGAIQFFSASNFLNSSGAFTIASTVTASTLQATATSSQFIFHGTTGTGTLSWSPSIAELLSIPNFGTATDTIVTTNFAQTLSAKTLNAPSVIAGMSIVQNAAATGLTLNESGAATALSIVNAPTSTQATSTVSITAGSNVAGTALLVANFGSGDAIQVEDSSSQVFAISGLGNTTFQPSNDTSTAFMIDNASGTNTLFAADTADNWIKIGDNSPAGTVPTLFGLDKKADAGDPTGFNGAMYYSSSSGEFRCDQAGVWYDCVPTAMQWQQAFFTGRWGYWAPTGITATTFTASNMIAPVAVGTAAASGQAEDYYIQWTSAATNGSFAGVSSTFTQTEMRYTPLLATRIRTDTATTSRRIWVALTSAALNSTDATGTIATTFIGVRYSTSAGDTTWQCGSGNGTTASYVSTGVAVTPSTYYDIIIDGTVSGQLTCDIATNGGSYVSVTKSTNVATSTTALGITNMVTTLTTTADIHRIAYVYLGGEGN